MTNNNHTAVREYALEHPEWRNYTFKFKFWTTSKISEIAIAVINKLQLEVSLVGLQ